MPTEQEILELVYRVKGQEEGKKLEEQLAANDLAAAKARAALDDLADAYQRGAVTGSEYAADKARLEAAIAGEERATAKLLKGYKGLAADTDRASKASGKLGLGFLEVSRAVEDAQYGFRGVINNIPQMIMLFGGTAGLASSLSLVAVGVNVLLSRLKELWSSLSEGDVRTASDQIKDLAEKVKELSEKPMRLRVEQVELDEATRKLEALKRGVAEFEAGQRKQKVHEAEAGNIVEEILAESETGRAAIQEKMRAQVEARDLANSVTIKDARVAREKAAADLAEIDAALEAATDLDERRGLIDAGGEAQRRLTAATRREEDARNKIADAAEQEVGGVIERARTGHGRDQAEAIADLARRLGAVGERGVASAVAGTSAEGLRRTDEEDAAFARRMDRAKQAGERRRDAAKAEKEARDAQADMLNEQGAQNEKPALAELGRANKERGTDQAELAAEAGRNEAAIDAEVKKIRDAVGKSLEAEYLARTATNSGAIAAGAPVARSRREEESLRIAGQDYALPPEEFERRLIGTMAANFRRRGAGEQAANLAATGIADRGNLALQQELAGKQGTNQERLIQVAAEHNAMFARLINAQGVQAQAIRQLLDRNRQMMQHVEEHQPSALNFGR